MGTIFISVNKGKHNLSNLFLRKILRQILGGFDSTRFRGSSMMLHGECSKLTVFLNYVLPTNFTFC